MIQWYVHHHAFKLQWLTISLQSGYVTRVVDTHHPREFAARAEYLPEYFDFVNAFGQSSFLRLSSSVSASTDDIIDERNRLRLAGVSAALLSLSNGYVAATEMLSRQEDKVRFYHEESGPACCRVATILRQGIEAEYYADWEKLGRWNAFLLGHSDQKPV